MLDAVEKNNWSDGSEAEIDRTESFLVFNVYGNEIFGVGERRNLDRRS